MCDTRPVDDRHRPGTPEAMVILIVFLVGESWFGMTKISFSCRFRDLFFFFGLVAVTGNSPPSKHLCPTSHERVQDQNSILFFHSHFLTITHDPQSIMSGNMGNRSPPFWPGPRRMGGPEAAASAGGGVGGGGGRGPFSPSMMRDEPQVARDDVIKGTDDDAIISKLYVLVLSAVQ